MPFDFPFRLRRRRATSLLAVALACAPLGCQREKPYEKPLTPVSVRAVEEYAGGGGLRYSGNIEPCSRVDLAFRVGGYVQEIMQVAGEEGRPRALQEGDAVAKGAVLARVRESDYQVKADQARAQVAQAASGLEQARSQLKEALASEGQARLDLERAAKLLESHSLTKSDYDGARTRWEVIQARVEAARAGLQLAEARLAGARAQLAEAEIALRDCALKAPLDALVLKRLIEVGSLVGPGSPAFLLADTTAVKVVFGAPDVLLPSLKPGAPLAVTTEALPGAEFRGRITRIAPAADPRSRVFDVEITIPNPQGRLKAGMIAAIQVAAARLSRPVPVVPLAAIVRSSSEGYAVFVVEGLAARPVARAREVKLGETFGNLIAVTAGLKPGERVITSGATLVRDGETVEVMP